MFIATEFYYLAFFPDFQTKSCDNMGVCFFAFIDSTWKDEIWSFTSFDYSGENPWRFG